MTFTILLAVFGALVAIALVWAGTAYRRLLKVYNKYDNEFTYSNLSGQEFAQFAIQKFGLKTKIGFTEKDLSDCYSPKHDTIYLSKRTAQNRSVASICVTAHELGHAVQKKNKSKLCIIQNAVFVLNIIFKFVFWPLIITGVVLLFFPQYNVYGKIMIIVALASLTLSYILKIVTIPVEYDASKIAYNFFILINILNKSELKDAKKVLNAAAGTYVASLFSAALKLFRMMD